MDKKEMVNISPEEGKVYFYSEIWEGRDKSFLKSWCNNIFNYTKLKFPEDFDKSKLDFYDVQSKKRVARFNPKHFILF